MSTSKKSSSEPDLWCNRPDTTLPLAIADPSEFPTAARVNPPFASPLRVTAINVKHFSKTPAGDVDRGLLGRDSFAPVLGDSVQVTAHLSRPGYAYLIAFRPGAPPDLCFPESEETPPPLTDEPRYPTSQRAEAYELSEGTGLWVFAAIVSAKPLPPFKTIQADIKRAWIPASELPPATVWWDDGETRLEQWPSPGIGSISRGKGKTLVGPAKSILQLTDALRTIGHADSASSLGFGVTPIQ